MEQEKIDKAKEWWYEISDHQTTELIMKHKLRKPIKDTDIVKLFAIYSVSNAERTVCGYWGSCNFKGNNNRCYKLDDCGSKKLQTEC